MNNETFSSTLNLYTKPGKEEEFKSLLQGALPDTKNYEGCLLIVMNQDRNDKTHFLIHGEWKSETIYNEYLQWRTETGIFEKLASFLTKEPEICRYDNVFGGYISEKIVHPTGA